MARGSNCFHKGVAATRLATELTGDSIGSNVLMLGYAAQMGLLPLSLASILEAIVATDYNSVVGPIKWSGKPVKNVSKTPLVAGQWRKTDKGFELVICENSTAPSIPTQDTLKLLG